MLDKPLETIHTSPEPSSTVHLSFVKSNINVLKSCNKEDLFSFCIKGDLLQSVLSQYQKCVVYTLLTEPLSRRLEFIPCPDNTIKAYISFHNPQRKSLSLTTRDQLTLGSLCTTSFYGINQNQQLVELSVQNKVISIKNCFETPVSIRQKILKYLKDN